MTADYDLDARDDNREYRNEHIVVRWEPALCIHAAFCVADLPAVFNARVRPWVNLEGAEPDEVARVVASCPSGAITYQRLDK
jgi:uncharacterized Fe-S cluster protein YjdI